MSPTFSNFPILSNSRDLHPFDLGFYLFVFRQFSFQETRGDSGFLLQAAGGQVVDIRDFLVRVFQALDLDDSLFRQYGEHVIGFSQADAHAAGHFALGYVGLGGEDLQDAVAGFLFEVRVHAGNV